MSDAGVIFADRSADRRIFGATIFVIFVVFGIGTVPQAAFQAATRDGAREPQVLELLPDVASRLLVNCALMAIAVLLLLLVRPLAHRGWRFALDVAIVCLGCAAARVPLQVAFGFYGFADWRTATVESVTAGASVLAIVGSGLLHVSIRRRIRAQERAFVRQSVRASAALDALATEELRVRREVAEGLHGTVQQNLVLLGVRMDALADRLRDGAAAPAHLAELAAIRGQLDAVRENDVRTMSQLLYPVGLELGAVAAVRLLLQRLPATIATTMSTDDGMLELEGNGNTRLSVDRRLLLVRVVEEALSNALRHGRASAIAVRLSLDGGAVSGVFADEGGGRRGQTHDDALGRLRERRAPLGGRIAIGPGSALGGARLTASIPVDH